MTTNANDDLNLDALFINDPVEGGNGNVPFGGLQENVAHESVPQGNVPRGNVNHTDESTPFFGIGQPSMNVQSMSNAMSLRLLPEKFGGKGFKTWQHKMLFFLTTINLDKYLKEDPPVLPMGNTDTLVLASIDSWNHSDFLCKSFLLQGLIDPLYDVYSKVQTSKQLWSVLEKKYKSEDAVCQKFAMARFLNFKMVDSKPIMEQVGALQLLMHEIAAEGMKTGEIFTVNCFIEKLPPSWVDFKNYLTHKRKAISLEDLIVKLRVESHNRKVNAILDHENIVNVARHKNKGRNKFLPKTTITHFKEHVVVKKFVWKCHQCGKMGHKADACRSKGGPKHDNAKCQANLTEADLCADVTEVNTVLP